MKERTVTPVWEITARVWLVNGILKRFLLDTGIRKDLFSYFETVAGDELWFDGVRGLEA